MELLLLGRRTDGQGVRVSRARGRRACRQREGLAACPIAVRCIIRQGGSRIVIVIAVQMSHFIVRDAQHVGAGVAQQGQRLAGRVFLGFAGFHDQHRAVGLRR